MRLWRPAKQIEPKAFESQQDKLQRMSEAVLTRYHRELNAEISDPARLTAVYGASFANANIRQQAEAVAMMASQMLRVPNARVSVITAEAQESIAVVENAKIASDVVPLEDSWCKHVIGTGREMAVRDASTHPLVCDTEYARNGSIVSYLGVPVANPDGVIVGVLCVYDDKHRDWQISDVGMLTQLSFVLTRAMNVPS